MKKREEEFVAGPSQGGQPGKKKGGKKWPPKKTDGHRERVNAAKKEELQQAIRLSAIQAGVRMGKKYRAVAETSESSEEEFLAEACQSSSPDESWSEARGHLEYREEDEDDDDGNDQEDEDDREDEDDNHE